MSISTQFSRIQSDRNTIRAKLVELGMATNTDNLDTLAAAIEALVNQGAVSVEIMEGTTYTIPAGYHNGSGVVKAITDTSGESEKYKTQEKTVTPTKKQQSVTPSTGYYALSAVTVAAIPDAYQDVTSVTTEAGDVLTGKIYVAADGTVVTGTMVNNGTVSRTLDTTTISFTIPKGYHSGTGTVTITLEEKTVTPTKSTQTVTPTSGKVLSKVTVDPIPDEYITTDDATAAAEQILEGESAYVNGEKVEGTMPDNGGVVITLGSGNDTYRITKGYHNGDGGVSVSKETKTVTPTESQQVVTPTQGKFLEIVNVNPIPGKYGNTEDATVTADKLLVDEIAYGYDSETGKAVKVVGTMANNGDVSSTIDGLTTISVTIPEGYTSGGTISLTDDIETMLASI